MLFASRPFTSLPTRAAEVNPDLLKYSFRSAYLLRPGLWDRNLVTGRQLGTTTGAGFLWSPDGFIQTRGVAGDGALLPHGLNVNIQAPFSIVIGSRSISGTVCWSLLQHAANWYGWYGEGTGSVSSTDNNSFDGSLVMGGNGNVAFSVVGTNNFRGSSGRGITVDSSVAFPSTVNRSEVALGYSRWDTDDNAAAAVITHFAAFQSQLPDGLLNDLAANPAHLFVTRRALVPVGISFGGATHASTGALSADAATVAGTASHLTLHTTSGVLSAQAATVTGTAAHQHVASGALAAQSAAVAGTAARLTLHTTSGALAAQDASVSGDAAHTTPGAHATSGALSAQDSAVAGTAAHLTLHATSGALTAQAATVAGVAVHNSTHTSSGALVAQSATVSGQAQLGAGTLFDHDFWLKQWKKKHPATTVYTSPQEVLTETAPLVDRVVKQAARSKSPAWDPARLETITQRLNVAQKLAAAVKRQIDEEDDETILLLL